MQYDLQGREGNADDGLGVNEGLVLVVGGGVADVGRAADGVELGGHAGGVNEAVLDRLSRHEVNIEDGGDDEENWVGGNFPQNTLLVATACGATLIPNAKPKPFAQSDSASVPAMMTRAIRQGKCCRPAAAASGRLVMRWLRWSCLDTRRWEIGRRH